QLIPQVIDKPKRSRSDRHATPAYLGGINFRDDNPTCHAIAEGMAGDETHYTNQDRQAAPVNMIEPADQGKRDKLQCGPSDDECFSPSAIHSPERKEGEQQID